MNRHFPWVWLSLLAISLMAPMATGWAQVPGTIVTVAGNGTQGLAGDGGPATEASLYFPTGVFVDKTGTPYITDSGTHRIRKVDATTGIITTCKCLRTYQLLLENITRVRLALFENETVVLLGLRLLLTFGDSG
jgi:hypothetical protein